MSIVNWRRWKKSTWLSTNWGHYFYVPYWRRNRHFLKLSSEPREGLAICKVKVVSSFLSLLKTLIECWSDPENRNPLPPALQSSALPTELILLQFLDAPKKYDHDSLYQLNKMYSTSFTTFFFLILVLLKKLARVSPRVLKPDDTRLRLLNLWYRSTHSCTDIQISWGYFGLKNWTQSLAVSLSVKTLIKHKSSFFKEFLNIP